MAKKRQLATTSPGDKPKRTQKVLDRAEGIILAREAVATNVRWILDHSSARGSIPRMHQDTGLGINTIRRILAFKGGTTVDTLAVIADVYGVPIVSLFRGLTEKDQHLVKMFADMKKDIASLKAKATP